MQTSFSPAQLAELNRLLREERPSATTMRPAAVVVEDNRFAGQDEGEIRSSLVGTVAGWAPGTVFTLTNGQQWQVLKGEMTLEQRAIVGTARPPDTAER